jgi:hypothetical protein
MQALTKRKKKAYLIVHTTRHLMTCIHTLLLNNQKMGVESGVNQIVA